MGSGEGIGERAVLSSQKWVKRMAVQYGTSTRLIAASLRNPSQMESLAGVDIYTMPVKVAAEGRISLKGPFVSKLQEEYPVDLNERARECHLEKFWEVGEKELLLVRDLADDLPCCGSALTDIANKEGCGDLFPELSSEDKALIASDGKIPVHAKWESRLRSGELAVDSLLNLAGLASFAHDQAQLDKRIESIIA
jgi:transaldolase